MCILTRKIADKKEKLQIEGYKVALKKDGKYFSSLTGIEYEINKKIPKITYKKISKSDIFSYDFGWSNRCLILNPGGYFFDKEMKGKTAIFKNIKDARYTKVLTMEINCKEYEVVILKLLIGGNLYEGYMNSKEPIYA